MERGFAPAALEDALRMVNDGRAAINYLPGKGEYADGEKHPFAAVLLLDLNLP